MKQEINNNLTDESYWESLKRKTDPNRNVLFSKVFNKFLKKEENSKRIALEIGCVPGKFLGYICKNFGYFPEGIDFIKDSKKITQKTLKKFGIKKSIIYEEDFLKWTPKKKYDLVCSFGFIEHFKDPQDIISKHINLLKKNGVLILEIPNFNYCQKTIRNYLDKNNLDKHNTQIMNLTFFEEISKKFNLKINFLSYYGGLFDFWWENKNPSLIQIEVFYLLKVISIFTKRIKLNNKFFSPFIIFIATKK